MAERRRVLGWASAAGVACVVAAVALGVRNPVRAADPVTPGGAQRAAPGAVKQPTPEGRPATAPSTEATARPVAPGRPREVLEATWRALDALDTAALDAPRLVSAYGMLLKSGTQFNRNPYAKHTPPRDRLDLLVTRFMDARKKTFDLRAALYVPPPARVTFQVKVPARARLRVGLARTGAPATAKILVDDEALATRRPQGRWEDLELDLGRFAGKEVRLAFVTEGRGHVFFADPTILGTRSADDPRAGRAAVDAPNVIVILVDTLAAWSLGAYGQSPSVTPELDRFARQGVRFDNAIAQANWTRPSVTSMLSSWLPGKIGITYNVFHGHDIAPERRAFYARAPDLAPAALRRAGYVTGALVNNLFLQGYHKYGVDMGFEQVVDYRTHVEDTVDITSDAIAFVKRNQKSRFFLFLNYNAPHIHYVPPARYAAEVNRLARRKGPKTRAYLGEVRYTDAEVGRLLRALDSAGISDNTMVILSADHGEVHDPRHAYRVVRTGRSSLYSHAVTMYDEEVKVPLVLRWPGKLPAGAVVKNQVRHLDFAPTMLELAGLPASPKHQGKSYLGLARGQEEADDRVAFTEGRMMRGVRQDGFKYFLRLPGYERIGRGGRVTAVAEELYDLRNDPSEHVNVAGKTEHAERLASLRALGQDLMKRAAVPDAAPARSAHALPASLAPPQRAASPSPGSAAPPGAKRKPKQPGLHLLFVSDGTRRRFEGRLHVDGGARHFRLTSPLDMDAIWRDASGDLRFRIEVEKGKSGLWVQPKGSLGAAVRLELTMDGAPAPLRVGGFGLPLVEAGRIAGPELALLDAAEPPTVRPGRELGAFLWRDPVIASRLAAAEGAPAAAAPAIGEAEERPEAGGAGEREVEGMMRDWGYIQESRKAK